MDSSYDINQKVDKYKEFMKKKTFTKEKTFVKDDGDDEQQHNVFKKLNRNGSFSYFEEMADHYIEIGKEKYMKFR